MSGPPAAGILGRMPTLRTFSIVLIASMVLCIACGWWCNHYLSADQAASVASNLSLVTTAFLRLIRMIIAPLIFSTLVSAIARMDGAAEIGRVGLKSLVWFIGASCVSLALGLAIAALVQPGAGIALPIPDAIAGVATNHFSLDDFVTHLIPRSIFEAMANNEILQIVIFALFFGVAMAGMKEKAARAVDLCEELASIMLRVTDYVMKAAPLAIFAALAATIATQGIGILGGYAKFVGGYYFALAILWAVFGIVIVMLVGRRAFSLIGALREPTLLAFATASSEAAYPRLLEALVAFGASRRVTSLVLPLGYSFNLDGAMVYCAFAIQFIAQAYGIEMPLGQQLGLFALLMLATKGSAGVPRAATVIVAAMLPLFKLPEAGILLVLAVDQILDMGRSATNVVGNAVAATAVSLWENRFDDPILVESKSSEP
jgi:Na+/H+-dicarboxylate symporter